MKQTDKTTRRRIIQLTGATAATALVAGCSDGGGPGSDNATGGAGNETGGAGNETGGEGNETGGEGNETGGEGNETGGEGNETGGEGNETGGGAGGGGAIEPGTQILFEAQTQGWQGVEPSDIEGEQNPTITLQEGEDYQIGWEEGDGSIHNIEIRDDSDEVVDDYATEESDQGGEEQILDITASSEMAAYVCNPHETTMNGEIQVE